MKLYGAKELVENEDFIKWKNGHVIISTNNLLSLLSYDGFEYKIIFSDDFSTYRTINFYRHEITFLRDPRPYPYFDEVHGILTFIDFQKELEDLKKKQEFNQSFEDHLND